MERVKGIEPSSRFTKFKALRDSLLRFCSTYFLALFILTFILTSWQALCEEKSPGSGRPVTPIVTGGN
jgi:hypothetical protein